MTKHNFKTSIKPLGDAAIIVQLGDGIDPTIQKRVNHLSALLTKHPFEGFVESVPAYNSLSIYYNPYIVYHSQIELHSTYFTPFQKVRSYIETLLNNTYEPQAFEARIIEIPVIYGGGFGPDLNYVAKYHGLTADEVIRIHTSSEYLVYMIGFAPGFPFLGGLNEQIATPRKKAPRYAIPPGSVGIAGKQTGVYPLETPGGWQIIGQTPLNLFLPEQSPPTLLQPGDKIRFKPITAETYSALKGENL